MFNNFVNKTVRSSAVLTTSYVAGTVLGLDGENLGLFNQLSLFCDFTVGSLTSCEIKVEFSHDNSSWFQESVETVGTGLLTYDQTVHQLTATGKFPIFIPFKAKYVKISSKGTGTVTNSLLAITAALSLDAAVAS